MLLSAQPNKREPHSTMAKKRTATFVGFGAAIAVATVFADQLAKYLVLQDIGPGEVIAVTPFLDLVLAMNRGISYGMFQQNETLGRWFLVMVNLGAAGLFALWLFRAESRLIAAAVGFLIGGALGNAFDRSMYGAVVDFISLHAYGWRWYVFNVADAAIVAGVIGLLYDASIGRATK
jgi:signal peptidase II